MLIFDLDGTLIDSNGVWLEVDKTFLARRNAPYTQEYYEGVAHSILSNCAPCPGLPGPLPGGRPPNGGLHSLRTRALPGRDGPTPACPLL